jgi:hypothetical protein
MMGFTRSQAMKGISRGSGFIREDAGKSSVAAA